MVNLSLLSKELNKLVCSYVFSKNAKGRFANESRKQVTHEDERTNEDPFHTWGKFLFIIIANFHHFN